MSNGVEQRDDAPIAPGQVYRDLDGSLVHLLGVRSDLCTWVPIGGSPATVQVTHSENFRRRFRKLDSNGPAHLKRSA